MSRILVRSASYELGDRLASALAGTSTSVDVSTVTSSAASDPASLWRDEVGGPPEVVVLDCAASGVSEALALTARLDAEFPGVSVVLVTEAGNELALPALRAGATDILDPFADPLEMLRVAERAVDLAEVQSTARAPHADGLGQQSPRGRLISVVSPKGGVGKTTVATNLAVGLARSAPQATVLVDLDLQFGDVASSLNLDPEYFLPATVSGAAAHDAMVLKTYLTLHETGLYVVCAPETPAEADGISVEDVRQLLRTLTAEFRYVIVDTAPGLSDHTLAVMDETTDLLLLTSMDVPSLRGLRKEIDTLRALDLLQDRRSRVVVNFADPSAGLTTADIELTLGAPVDLNIPRSKAAPTSVNLGIPLLQSGVRDPMTKQLRALVQQVTTGDAPAQVPAPVRKLAKRAATPAPRRAAPGWFSRPRVLTS